MMVPNLQRSNQIKELTGHVPSVVYVRLTTLPPDSRGSPEVPLRLV